MNYLDIYSLNETTRISAHNVIHHYLCIVSSEKSDSNGYLSKRIRMVERPQEMVTYETGLEDHGGDGVSWLRIRNKLNWLPSIGAEFGLSTS